MYWAGAQPRARGPKEQRVQHPFASDEGRQEDVNRLHRVRSVADQSLFRHGHAGRYFGALWFKVFDERGPC
jgi:hypothetical protein